jgi:hypothetical protein
LRGYYGEESEEGEEGEKSQEVEEGQEVTLRARVEPQLCPGTQPKSHYFLSTAGLQPAFCFAKPFARFPI